MRFEIDNTIEPPQEANAFYVAITVMFGDADAYETFEVGPFTKGRDETALTSLVETLDRMSEDGAWDWGTYKYSSWDDQHIGYDNIEGFHSWFGTSMADDEAMYSEEYRSTVPYEAFKRHYDLNGSLKSPYYDGWPSQEHYGDSKLEGFKLTYYDHTLVPWTVEIVR
ncbi:hypothetical protein SEA_CECE_50 [Microbacterium phage Cece]|nr:hypothetical protein SEA_CECE_50 [Microbacterium phage Cece]